MLLESRGLWFEINLSKFARAGSSASLVSDCFFRTLRTVSPTLVASSLRRKLLRTIATPRFPAFLLFPSVGALFASCERANASNAPNLSPDQFQRPSCRPFLDGHLLFPSSRERTYSSDSGGLRSITCTSHFTLI
jgi:hypothetical protein